MTHPSPNRPIHSTKDCVVYDAATGQIRHVHRVVTFVGGREPRADEIEADALRAAGKLRSHHGDLLVLQLGAEAVEPTLKYRVDPAKKVLIPLS
jgi:hypothetical protein